MRKWTALDWIKYLTIILLVCVIGFIIFKLLPFFHPVFLIIKLILYPVFIAMVISYLLHPIIEYLHKRGLPRSLAILIIYLLFFGGVGYGIIKGTPFLINQLTGLLERLPQFTKTYQDHVKFIYHVTPEALHDHLNSTVHSLEQYMHNLTDKVIGSIRGFIQSFFVITMIPLLVFYFLKDIERIKEGCWKVTPTSYRESSRSIMNEINNALGNYVRGQLYVCLFLAILGSLGLWLFKIPYPIILGIFIGLTDIIPYFGPIIGAVPAAIVAMTISVKSLILVVLLIVILQFIESNLIGPLIVGKSAAVHPVYIMLSLLVGGEIAGVVGMLLAVPAFVVIRILIFHIYHGLKQGKLESSRE